MELLCEGLAVTGEAATLIVGLSTVLGEGRIVQERAGFTLRSKLLLLSIHGFPHRLSTLDRYGI